MAYTAKDAVKTFFTYLEISENDIVIVPNTKERGIIFNNSVIFISPVSYSAYNDKGFFDTRDSGAKERVIAWKYAKERKLKYFCVAVQEIVDQYKNYIFSLECSEKKIQDCSGKVTESSRERSGTQIVIPRTFKPQKNFERIITEYGFYISASKGKTFLTYMDMYDNRPFETDNESLHTDKDKKASEYLSISPYTQNFSQTIYYGVPGSGKSHEVDKIIDKNVPNKDDRLNQVIRVVFHPDYTNADFVGQVMPYVNDGIEYRFKAGPFTRILKHAYKEHSKHFYLVIEEINRGNAAAIFGELFQLLDRDNDGFSCYSLNNPDITSFIMSKDDYYNDKILPESVEVGGEKWILDSPIRLPPNLSILATMNTSDQNVFTLDNAFQRRWDMELVPNTLDIASAQYNAKIADSRISWGIFREFINEQISKKSVGTGLSSMEDKRLGGWFVKASGNIAKEVFANKVLKYLYDDAFKFSRQEIFAEYENFETLHSDFVGKNGNDRFSIFTDEIKNALFDEASKDAHQDVTSDETGQDAPNGDNADA